MNDTPPAAHPLRALLIGAGIGAAALAVDRLGRGALAPPPSWNLDDLRAWAHATGPVTAALALLRIAVLAAFAHTLAVAALGGAARAARRPDLAGRIEGLSLPPLRSALTAASGVAVTLIGLTAPSAPTLRAAGAVGSTPTVADLGAVSIERLAEPDDGGDEQRGPAGTATMRAVDTPPDDSPNAVGSDGATAGLWTVRPGDHLWHIAETTLQQSWGRTPSEPEVAAYWADLIEANAEQVTDPDLIHPGQTVLRPTPPSR